MVAKPVKNAVGINAKCSESRRYITAHPWHFQEWPSLEKW